MKNRTELRLSVVVFAIIAFQGCTNPECCTVKTSTITIYSDHTIPANTGISPGTYTAVDGYRYVNVVVEFEQNAAGEEPVSLGVMFAHSQGGELGSRRYFTFDENFSGPADPQMITETGQSSWHGQQHGKSAYIARLPIMGPYLQVLPFNHHDEERSISIRLYLTG